MTLTKNRSEEREQSDPHISYPDETPEDIISQSTARTFSRSVDATDEENIPYAIKRSESDSPRDKLRVAIRRVSEQVTSARQTSDQGGSPASRMRRRTIEGAPIDAPADITNDDEKATRAFIGALPQEAPDEDVPPPRGRRRLRRVQ